jgi:dihydropteroate synthase
MVKFKPKIVGILNLTPDSFSDGGKYFNEETALFHLAEMMMSGVDIVDIGAESTRPNAQILNAQEEISRLENILPKLISAVKNFNKIHHKNIQTSIDSYHLETIIFAHKIGVEIINDVSGLIDEKIIDYIAQNNLTAILMHNLAIHSNPDLIVNRDLNVVDEIINWGQQKIAYLTSKKIQKSQLIFDPGIGFAKNSTQSIRILKNINALRVLNLPIYVGHSKKSFLDAINIPSQPNLDRTAKTLILSQPNLDRTAKTLILSQYLAQKNVDYLRVHDVKENIEAIDVEKFEKEFF